MVLTRSKKEYICDIESEDTTESVASGDWTDFTESDSEGSIDLSDCESSSSDNETIIIKIPKMKRHIVESDDEEPINKKLKFNDIESQYLDTNTVEQSDLDYLEHEYARLISTNDIMPIRFQILNSKLPDKIKSILLKRYLSIEKSQESADEYQKTHKWIKTVLDLPIGNYKALPVNNTNTTEEICDFLVRTKQNLDSKIYGHKSAKEQILRILAQWVSKPDSKGNVIGIYGAKGTGKTSLIKEGFGHCLGLPYSFIPLGGIKNSDHLLGHTMAYIGSAPGLIVDSLTSAGVMNPIFMFDELDKVSQTKDGAEIIGVLTHLTDSSQNSHFHDNYLNGIDLDLSKSIIVFSYNDPELIDPILKDRMITIKVDSYTPQDKVNICKNYLLPSIVNEFGMTKDDITISDETIINIINKIPDEDGVRNLKRSLECIISWLNINKYLMSPAVKFPVTITDKHVSEYIKTKESNEKWKTMYT
jgi:ATP-dependent Lon protease